MSRRVVVVQDAPANLCIRLVDTRLALRAALVRAPGFGGGGCFFRLVLRLPRGFFSGGLRPAGPLQRRSRGPRSPLRSAGSPAALVRARRVGTIPERPRNHEPVRDHAHTLQHRTHRRGSCSWRCGSCSEGRECLDLAYLPRSLQATLDLRVEGSIPSRLTKLSSALSDGAK